MEFKKYPSMENSYRGKFIAGFVSLYPELLAASFVIVEKVHGCLTSQARITMADGVPRYMSQICVGDYVMGQAGGVPVPSRVLCVHRNGRAKKWLLVRGTWEKAGRGGHYFSIRCTPEHRFWLPIRRAFIKAGELVIGDAVLSVRRDWDITPMQDQVLLGKMLGDGSLHIASYGAAAVTWVHGQKQDDYSKWTARALGELCSLGADYGRVSGYGTPLVRRYTKFCYRIAERFRDFIGHNGRKCVPAWVADALGPVALAFWYMDDGSLAHNEDQEDRAHLATCAFSQEDCQVLTRGLARFGIEAVYYQSEGYSRLRLNADDAERLFLLIAPYILPSMQYKLPERYRGHASWLPLAGPSGQYKASMVQQKITSVGAEEYPRGKLRYDLETETGNYFAHHVLVHNSNLSVSFSPNAPWQYGKRTAFLKEDEKFYSAQDVAQQYTETFWDIQEWVDRSADTTVRLFGELYGPGVQKGVNYSPEKRIGFYDMMVDDELLAPAVFRRQSFMGLQQNALPMVATVTGLLAALDFNVEFNSLLNPIEGNICEGVVIAPFDKVYYDSLGRRFCLKKKNPEFMEKVKAAKPKQPTDPVLTRLNLEFRSYITDNRLQSIFSQHGEIEEPSQIGEYIRFVLGDAKEDFLKDFSKDVTVLSQGNQRKVFNVGSMIALMLKGYL